jgi:hypothetical protein
MKYRIISVCTDLYECEGIEGKGRLRSRRVFKVLKDLGCRFFNFSPEYPLERMPIDPEDGDILPNAGLFHPALAPSASALEGATEGDGTFSFVSECGLFNVGQRVYTAELDRFDATAARHIDFFKVILPQFRPQFATIDEFGENGMSETVIARRRLTDLLWFNVFGPGYCDKFSKEFFLKAPAWQTEDLGDYGVAVRTTKRLSAWLTKPDGKLVTYFCKQFPGIKPYRARRS